MKRHGLGELSSFFLVVVIGVMLIVGGTLFYGGVQTSYGVAFTNATNGTSADYAYQKLNSTVVEVSNDLKTSQPETNPFAILLSGAISALMKAFTLIDVITSLASGVAGFFSSALGLPVGWAIVLLLGVLGLYFTFRILEIITRGSI
jgi:hypothetical protein